MAAAATEPETETPPPGSLRQLYGRLARSLGNAMPKGLFARSLIIIIAPVVVLQSLVVFVFMERNWQDVTQRLSEATVGEIAALGDGSSSSSRLASLPRSSVRRRSANPLRRSRSSACPSAAGPSLDHGVCPSTTPSEARTTSAPGGWLRSDHRTRRGPGSVVLARDEAPLRLFAAALFACMKAAPPAIDSSKPAAKPTTRRPRSEARGGGRSVGPVTAESVGG